MKHKDLLDRITEYPEDWTMYVEISYELERRRDFSRAEALRWQATNHKRPYQGGYWQWYNGDRSWIERPNPTDPESDIPTAFFNRLIYERYLSYHGEFDNDRNKRGGWIGFWGPVEAQWAFEEAFIAARKAGEYPEEL